MASEMETPESQKLKFAQREEMKKLRNCGLTYISRSGKVIAAKTQSDVLCQCPQKCSEKLPTEARNKLFTEFYKMGDHELQNEFLRAHIQAIPVRRRRERIPAEIKINGRAQRRVTCKYLLPIACNPDGSIKSDPTVKGQQKVEVCQKAFMHMYAITEKRVRLQREKLIARLKEEQHGEYDIDQSDEPLPIFTDTISEGVALPNNEVLELDSLQKQMVRDVTMVDNFFNNQLWKPEYMMPLKKVKSQKPQIPKPQMQKPQIQKPQIQGLGAASNV